MSNTAPTLSKPAAIRRFRYAIQAFALLFAATAVCVFVAILGDRFPRRLDATATREHHLSARTTDLLNSLDGQYEMVVAANFSTLDQAAARRTQDVLDNFGRAAPEHIRTTIIDVSSSRGLADLDALLARLVERFGPEIEKQRKGVASSIARATTLNETLNTLSTELLAARDTVHDGDPSAAELRRFFTDSASVCRIASEDLSKAVATARECVSRTMGRTSVPATEDAIAAMRVPLSNTMAQISKIGENLDLVLKRDEKVVKAATREIAAVPAAKTVQLRSDIGEGLAALDDLPRTPIPSVLRVLERTSAAIIIGPPGGTGSSRSGVTSVELSSIYPPKPPEGADSPQTDLRARTEELLAGAVTALARADAPILVFVHGKGVHMAPDYIPVRPIVERMRLRGVDFAEWAAGLDADPPSLKSLDPQGKRPVVYIVVSMAGDTTEEVTRFGKLVKGVERLLAEGRSVLTCEVPSTMPSLGQKDPIADVLTPLGVQVDTGRPLLRQMSGPRGRIVTADLGLANPGTDHPIALAIRGLTLYLPWAVPVRLTDGAPGVRPVVVIENEGKTIWAESEFLAFLQTPANHQPLLANPPEPDSSRDDPAGPWPVVATVERSAAGKTQRVVVVGCNKWMAPEVMGAESEVEGRRVPTYPGNIELLDACVYWLAGQDSMISASPEAQQVPLIPPLSEAQMNALRWGLIGGLPLLILLIGAMWRLARG